MTFIHEYWPWLIACPVCYIAGVFTAIIIINAIERRAIGRAFGW